MRKLFLFLSLSLPCMGQVQGLAPNLIDAATDQTPAQTSGSIAWPENVAINDTIVCGFNTDSASTFTVADSLTNTWTMTSHTTTPAPQATMDVWLAYTKSTSAGADTITLTRTSGTGFFYMFCGRFSSLGAVDGTPQSATTGNATNPVTMSTSNTTTNNNDILVNITGGAPFGTHFNSTNNTDFIADNGIASPSIHGLLSMKRAGTLGAITSTNNAWGGSSTFAMQTLAFKPALGSATSSIWIADTLLPDVASGVAYTAQLHCIGGTAGQTYSSTGGALPTGLSLNTSTGVISGTTTAVGSYSLQFKCTDGTLTSAGQNLTMTVGALYNVPSVRQINNTWSGDNGSGGNFAMTVGCGSYILVFARGNDTHGSEGWVQATSGTNNYIKDSLGSPVRRVDGGIAGVGSHPMVVYAIGPTPSYGSDTITMANNQGASSARTVSLAAEVSGAQPVDPLAFTTTLINTASGTLSTNYTTSMPNTLLLSANDGYVSTMSLAGPFSTISAGGDIEGQTLYADDIVSSASTVTSALTMSSITFSNFSSWQQVVVPLRPALPISGCPVVSGNGEKFRRQPS